MRIFAFVYICAISFLKNFIKMPLNCCVPQCFANNRKNKGLSFFNFPKNVTLKKQWIIAIKTAKEPSRWSKVCSRHFTEDDFISNKGKIYIDILQNICIIFNSIIFCISVYYFVITFFCIFCVRICL